jgi:hypothetical protein
VSFSAVDTTPNACCAALGIVVLRRLRAHSCDGSKSTNS